MSTLGGNRAPSDLNAPLLSHQEDAAREEGMESQRLVIKTGDEEENATRGLLARQTEGSLEGNPTRSSGKPPLADPSVRAHGADVENEARLKNVEEWHRVVRNSCSDTMRRMSEQQLLLKPPPPPPFSVYAVWNWPWGFLKSQMQRFRDWFRSCWSELRTNHKLVILGLKAGIASTLLSIMCVLDDPYDAFESIGVWAVATADLVLESNVGMSFSKGINRTAGTLVAGIMALGVNKGGPYLGELYPYFVVLCVFLGGSIPTFFRYRPPFKDRWNYAVVMSQLTFHILILSGYNSTESLILPISRFGMILLGFVVVVLVNLSIKPNYAGDLLHALVSKNFVTAANLLERCIDEYRNGTVLDPVPRIWTGLSKKDDKIHNLYHEVVMSDVEVEKLLGAIPFEPSHGKFFRGYPWYRYDFITDFLRYMVYDIIGLDSCLRGEIQAPPSLRRIFNDELGVISKHSAETLKLISQGIKEMKWVDCTKELNKAEEGALRLQHKIGKEIFSILSDSRDRIPAISSAVDLTELASFAESGEPKMWNKVRELRKKAFIQRNDSIQRQWDATSRRVSALSFMKFSSMLLEIVAKLNFVVEAFDELSMDAKFEHAPWHR